MFRNRRWRRHCWRACCAKGQVAWDRTQKPNCISIGLHRFKLENQCATSPHNKTTVSGLPRWKVHTVSEGLCPVNQVWVTDFLVNAVTMYLILSEKHLQSATVIRVSERPNLKSGDVWGLCCQNSGCANETICLSGTVLLWTNSWQLQSEAMRTTSYQWLVEVPWKSRPSYVPFVVSHLYTSTRWHKNCYHLLSTCSEVVSVVFWFIGSVLWL